MTTIKIEKLRIKENSINEVTSDRIFNPKKIIKVAWNDEPELNFNDDGIFSRKIFGTVGVCRCGAKHETGFCPICGTRVISKTVQPLFYTKLAVRVPIAGVQYPTNDIRNIMNYSAFYYQGKVVHYSVETISDYLEEQVVTGLDALLKLGVDEKWYFDHTTDKIAIPHTSLREPTVAENGNLILGDINKALEDIVHYNITLKHYFSTTKDLTPFGTLTYSNLVAESVNAFYTSMFKVLAENKKSVVSSSVRGQDVTGAIRTVITNNFSLDEDVIVIGKYFIKTLYPLLYEKYGEDTDRVNIAIKDNLVLVNRAPSIGEKSIIAMKPVFSSKDSEKTVLQLNPIVFDGLAADVDGDTNNVIALYTKQATMEAELMLPSKNYLGVVNNEIRNAIPEDFVYTMQQVYQNDQEKAKEIHNLLWKGDE